MSLPLLNCGDELQPKVGVQGIRNLGLLQDLDFTGVDGLGGLSTMVVDVEKRNVRGEVGEVGDAGGKGACRGDSKTGLARGGWMFSG